MSLFFYSYISWFYNIALNVKVNEENHDDEYVCNPDEVEALGHMTSVEV